MDSLENHYYKIFKSLLFLEYKDSKLETIFLKNTHFTFLKMYILFANVLLPYSILMCLFEGSLVFYAISNDKIIGGNLFWNFIFCIGNLLLSLIIFVTKKNSKENKIIHFFSVFLLFFCYGNNNLSLTSILIVYFRTGIEIASFVFLTKIIVNFLISFFISRKFFRTIIIVSINLIYNGLLLLRIHITRMIIYYLITEFLFSVLLLIFAYMSEFIVRVCYYSYFKLEQERKYNLETLKFFNISYFVSKNFELTTNVKMDNILIYNYRNSAKNVNRHKDDVEINFKNLESMMKYLVHLDELPEELEQYLIESLIGIKESFKFKNMIEILFNKNISNTVKEEFNEFKKIGILKLKSLAKEDIYYQLFIKIRIKNNFENKGFDQNNILNKNVKIEGIFMDITHNYIKKETQANSLILSKYIHDIKSPLFLLKQVVYKYKKHNKFLLSHIKPIIDRRINLSSSNSLSPLTLKEINTSIYKIKEHSKYIKIISRNIFEIIETINNFTKKQQQNDLIQNSQCSKFFHKVNIRKLINSCVDFYNISVNFNPNKNNLKLVSEIDEKVPKFIFSNKLSVKQILMNLLSNSIKFTNIGEIKVECNLKEKLDKQIVEINVIDTGCGIDEENLSKLCQPFGITTSDKYGSGLGLNIVHDLLAKLNSKLIINSKRNLGSSFSFDLSAEEEIESDIEDSDKSSENSDYIETQKSSVNNSKENMNWELKLEELRKSSSVSYNSLETQMTVEYDLPLNKIKLIESEYYRTLLSDCEELEEDNLCEELNDPIFKNKINTKSSHSFYDSFARTEAPTKSDKIISSNLNKIFTKQVTKNVYTSKKMMDSFLNNSNLNEEISLINNNKEKSKESTTGFIEIFTNQHSIKSSCNSKVNQKKLNILLIDDDAIYAKQLYDQIKAVCIDIGCPIKVDFGYDPVEGLLNVYDSLKNKNEFYDVILIDENMPFFKGSTFVKMYTTMFIPNGFYKIPFVSISSDNMYNESGLKENFEYFLDKPCKMKEIKVILIEILKNMFN